MQATLEEKMSRYAELTHNSLDKFLSFDDEAIKKLTESMRYSSLAGGKRIRPFLTLLFCETFGGNPKNAINYACAIEAVHTYSLIHDDLPSMDNDDFRRGKPTNHKVFGEATATLAGDALLTYAFKLCAMNTEMSAEENIKAVEVISDASGVLGMVGGQAIDLSCDTPKTLEELIKMHSMKTGALIQSAVMLGIISAHKSDDFEIVSSAKKYANAIGLSFQIIDDIIDYTESSEETGKSSSDEKNGKTTFLSFMSCEDAFDYAVKTTIGGINAISKYDANNQLSCFAKYLLLRNK